MSTVESSVQAVTGKRGSEVLRPQPWEFVFGDLRAAKGWAALCATAANAADDAWVAITSDPTRTDHRQHRLKGQLGSGFYRGAVLPQWQYEATGASRIWYLVDKGRRLLVMTAATTGHPTATDQGKTRR